MREAEVKLIQTMYVFITCFLIGTVVSGVQRVVEFKDITLPCTVGNYSNDEDVKWYKYPNSLISTDTHVLPSYKDRMSVQNSYPGEWNLYINPVLDRDAGNYTCIHGEEVISDTKLVVERTVLSGVQMVVEFKDTTLSCTVRNYSNDKDVKWYKYPNSLISTDTHVLPSYKDRMSVQNSYPGEWNLYINPVLDRDAGNYTCIHGEEVISDTKLVVERTVLSGVQMVVEFKDTTLSCTVRNYSNDKDVKWYKYPNSLISRDTHVLPSYKDRMNVQKPYPGEWNLYINPVLDRDAGNYTCRHGEEVISDIKLVVETPPKIQETWNMTFEEGDTATLWCNTTGFPTPTVRWYWKPPNQADGNGEDSGAEGNRLLLHNVSRYYDNIYVCLVWNSVGTDRREIQIRVKFGPEVVVFQNTIIATKGQEVTFHCAVEAFPMEGDLEWAFENNSEPIRTDWKYEVRHDRDLENDFNTLFLSMTIRKSYLKDGDYGRYVCRTIKFSRGYSENIVVLQKPKEDKENTDEITDV